MKYDTDKAPLALIPPQVINQIAEVLGFGAEKYGMNNWRDDGHEYRVVSYIFFYSTASENAFWDCEDLDPESGKTHLAHEMQLN